MRLLYCDWSHTVMPFLFADVEYHGLIYGDAELREGVWYFRNSDGATPFFEQEMVNAVTTPLRRSASCWVGDG